MEEGEGGKDEALCVGFGGEKEMIAHHYLNNMS